jgi:predicted transposase YbfD/YdcC
VSTEPKQFNYADFPHSEQFITIERDVVKSDGTRHHELAFGVTSLTKKEASPERLLSLNRGHWVIENRIHYVRDVTFDEDRSRVRKENGPRTMATLRNLVISIFRLLGFEYIPQGIRRFSHWRCAEDTLRLLGL